MQSKAHFIATTSVVPANRPCRLLILFLILIFLPCIQTSAVRADGPPTRPFPRIEAVQHTAPIIRISGDAKGRWMVTASHDKTARIWDLNTGDLVRVLRPPIGKNQEGKLYAVAMSPDDGLVAVGGYTGWEWDGECSIYVFSRTTGALKHRVTGLPNVIRHLAFSPDGKRLAAALGLDNGIRIYRTGVWEEVGRDTEYGSDSYWVAFDQDGRLASTCYDGFIRLYNQDFEIIAKKKARGGKRPFGLAFSSDGSRIAVGFEDTTAVSVFSGQDLSFLFSPDTSLVNIGNISTVAWSRDGQTLLAGGKYDDSEGNDILVSWPEAGQGPARERPVSKNTIMDLAPLADGRLIIGATDPAWSLLDRDGQKIRGRGPALADFRTPSDVIRLSADGAVVEVDFDVLNSDNEWDEQVLRFNVNTRELILDPGSNTVRLQRRLATLGLAPGPADGVMGPRTRSALKLFQRERGLSVTGRMNPETREAIILSLVTGPRTKAPNLRITDWLNNEKPKLDGKLLELRQYETSFDLAIGPEGRRFLLGTHWYLRLYNRDGNLIWKKPAPSITWMVNLSADGRFAVAAFGDGSIRWFDARDGEERLALFVDGAAIARKGGSQEADSSAPNMAPYVAWTPDGFFHAGGGGERLMGWHLNHGADAAGELVRADQIGEIFRRPDLVGRALEPAYPSLARKALAEIGDLGKFLAQSRPPGIKRIGSAKVRQDGAGFEARFQVENRGGGVGRVEYRVNQVVVGQAKFRGRFGLGLPNRREESRPFTLSPGSHIVEARAFDAKGLLASPWVTWEVEITGKSNRPALHGLAVGVSLYRDRSLNLKYGKDDALAFAKVLEKVAKPLFRDVDVRTLVDEKASLAGIAATFTDLAFRTGPEDVFVLFLAGHGLAVEGRYHYIPHDLIYRNRASLEKGSLSEERLQGLLALVNAQKSLVVLDTCHSGAAFDEAVLLAADTRGGGVKEKAAIDRLMAKTGRAVLASTAHRDFALEGLEGHGVFTYVLLEGLKGRADVLGNRDWAIETAELANYLENEVPRLSRKVWKYEQYPMQNIQGQSFPIGLRPKTP